MNCKQVQKYASEYLDAKLPKSMLDLIEAHLSECEICRKYIAELRIILTKVSGLKTQAIAFDGWQNIKNSIITPKHKPIFTRTLLIIPIARFLQYKL